MKNRIILTGTVLGALLGLTAAHILANRHKGTGAKRSFSTREAILLGMELLKLLRHIGGLAKRG